MLFLKNLGKTQNNDKENIEVNMDNKEELIRDAAKNGNERAKEFV